MTVAESWVNQPIETLTEQLAEEAAAWRAVRRLKQAANWTDTLKDYAGQAGAAVKDYAGQAGSYLKSNPTAAGGLIGGGLGAAYGALREREEPEERRNTLGSALTGGVAGAAAGAGGGALFDFWKKMRNDSQTAVGNPPVGTFKHKGKDYRLKGDMIDPNSLENAKGSPSLFGLPESMGGSGLLNWKDHPILSGLAVADGANLTFGSVAEKLNPGGSIHAQALRDGIRKGVSPGKDALGGGWLADMLKNDEGIGSKLQGLLTKSDEELRQILLKAKAGINTGTGVDADLLRRAVAQGSSKVRGLNTGDFAAFKNKGLETYDAIRKRFGQDVGPRTADPLAGTGYTAQSHRSAPTQGPHRAAPHRPMGGVGPTRVGAPTDRISRLLRSLTGMQGSESHGTTTLSPVFGRRILPRLLAYGAYPLISHYAGDGLSNSVVNKLVQEHGEPVK